MIHDMDLPMCLWEEACNTAIHILNICPYNILKAKALGEALIGERLEVPHYKETFEVYPIFMF